jgi:hypothetical protein
MDGVASSPYLMNFRNAAVAILAQVVRMADEYRTLGCDLANDVAQRIFDDTVPATHLYPKTLFCAKLQPSKGKTSDWKACERALQTLSEIADHSGGRVPHQKSLHEQFVIYLGTREITWSYRESDDCITSLRAMLQTFLEIRRSLTPVAPANHPKLQVVIDKMFVAPKSDTRKARDMHRAESKRQQDIPQRDIPRHSRSRHRSPAHRRDHPTRSRHRSPAPRRHKSSSRSPRR